MASINWTEIFENYKGLWVALAEDEQTVIGSGATLNVAIEQAKAKGYVHPIVTRMPEELVSYVGAL